MLPKFRKGMLSLPERNGPDDLLGELQTMFSFLQETQRKFYDTKFFKKITSFYILFFLILFFKKIELSVKQIKITMELQLMFMFKWMLMNILIHFVKK